MKKGTIRFCAVIFATFFAVGLTLPILATDGKPSAGEFIHSDCTEIHDLEVIQSNPGEEVASPDNLTCTLTGHDYYDWMQELISTVGPTETDCFIKYWHLYKRCSRCGYAPEEPEPKFTFRAHEWEMSYAWKTCTYCGYRTEKGPFDGYSLNS